MASSPGGRRGPEALRFVDWPADAGHRWWQVLPLGPPDKHGSSYAGPSAFAGWPGLLARPRARLARAEADASRGRHGAWIGDRERLAGEGAVEDRVRFARRSGELREHAAARGVLLVGGIPFARAELGDVPPVAEDPGEITPAVRRLMAGLELSGLRVLRFAFTRRAGEPDLPADHPEPAVDSSGTRDDDTTAGRWASLGRRERAQATRAREQHGIRHEAPARAPVRLALPSPARTAPIPAQGLLGLGREARMDLPGRRGRDRAWRLQPGRLTAEPAAWLRGRTAEAGRLPGT